MATPPLGPLCIILIRRTTHSPLTNVDRQPTGSGCQRFWKGLRSLRSPLHLSDLQSLLSYAPLVLGSQIAQDHCIENPQPKSNPLCAKRIPTTVLQPKHAVEAVRKRGSLPYTCILWRSPIAAKHPWNVRVRSIWNKTMSLCASSRNPIHSHPTASTATSPLSVTQALHPEADRGNFPRTRRRSSEKSRPSRPTSSKTNQASGPLTETSGTGPPPPDTGDSATNTKRPNLEIADPGYLPPKSEAAEGNLP